MCELFHLKSWSSPVVNFKIPPFPMAVIAGKQELSLQEAHKALGI